MKGIILDRNTKIICDDADHEGVKIAAEWVREDLRRVFGEPDGKPGTVIIAGSMDKSGTIRSLCAEGAVSENGLRSDAGAAKWEVYTRTRTVRDGCDTIVIEGSDKRGTMYGLLTVSEACGVSPFVNWSGAAPARRESVELDGGFFGTSKEPSVKYRGIFINDEWPAFGNWATKRFGGVNAACYAEIFELLIRMHANYMWPAMWASNFSMDGPGLASAALADKLGIVMSTSHHEPCMRTGEEYRLLRGKDSPYGDAWDFLSNREGITRFWEDGLKRNAPFENVITMGMRGERDTAIMAEATLEENIALLKDIIRTQNGLIRKYIDPDLTNVPRQIVLFTEVEKFYYGDENTPGLIDDPEMDGITVVFSDNNYGYTRTLPTAERRGRNGGYGLYYHLDIHGGAYSYEWIGSTYLPRILDQLTTAYDYGIRDIWVVNVGDLVTQELEISYIMKLASDMDKYGAAAAPDSSPEYIRSWTDRIFGGFYSADDLADIREVISRYSLINERCKHEVMNERVYHPTNFGEARGLYESCKRIMELCDRLMSKTPDEIRTAFHELVYYPAYGTANLNRTWIVSEWNKFQALQNRNTANDWCAEIDEGVLADEKLVNDFHALADGKFYGHGLSEHFGFRFWNDSNNQLPAKLYIYPAYKDRMLISKTDESWYYDGREYTKRDETIDDLLRPDVDEFTLEISCGSRNTLNFSVKTDTPWLSLVMDGNAAETVAGSTDKTELVTVRIDREKLPAGEISEGTVIVSDGKECFVTFTLHACGRDYYEKVCRMEGEDIPAGAHLICCGCGAAEASAHSSLTSSGEAHYNVLSPYGRTGSGLKLSPNTADFSASPEKAPAAEYLFVTDREGEYEAEFVFAPSLPVNDSNSQLFSYSVNDGEPAVKDTVLDPSCPIFNSRQWAEDNRRNAKLIKCPLRLKKGVNSLTYRQLSPNLILERIVLRDTSVPAKSSYLGPCGSFRF